MHTCNVFSDYFDNKFYFFLCAEGEDWLIQSSNVIEIIDEPVVFCHLSRVDKNHNFLNKKIESIDYLI